MLIVGETGSGKTLLFRALAGLWPWGAGRISRPRGELVQYMPRIAYLPPGSLREVLAYPAETGDYKDEQYGTALERLKLPQLIPMLDQSKRWDQELNEEEQQRLAFARLVLQTPPWLVIDEALDSLDEQTLTQVRDVFAHELKNTGLIHIGREQPAGSIYSSTLHLVVDPNLRRITRSPPADNRTGRKKKESVRVPA